MVCKVAPNRQSGLTSYFNAYELRPLPVVTKTAEIATLLAALNLPRTHQHPWAHGPTAVTGTVVVDARTGTAFPVDAPPAPLIRST